MIRHHEIDHSLHQVSWPHPAEQTKARLTVGSVGRYRKELAPAMITVYESIAGDVLTSSGYSRGNLG
ncbi:hypothetical protein AB0M79_18945 [Polymorphospora sp. NPDC051019]|uniref:hypothetical protein n=1 Tax=Polymorphospora sp. NPDC051019 TaxID=3155725 RepID=UPI00344696CB